MLHPYRLRPTVTPDRLAALALTLAPFVYFYPALAGTVLLAPDDGLQFNVPLRVAAARIVTGGDLPLWNPYIFSGIPLHAAVQAGLLFPLNWTYLVLAPQAATNLTMLLTYALAGVGALLYARRAGADLVGASVTGLIWPFCGFMVGQIGHTNIVHAGALLPWVLWAVDAYAATGARRRAVLVSVLVALQAFAGHPQTFAHSLVLVWAYVATRALCAQRGGARGRYLWSLAFTAAGLLLAAGQLLPTAELVGHSLRATITYDVFSSFSLPPQMLWTFVAPYVVGGGDGSLFRAPYTGTPFYGEYIGYVGLSALALAALALVLRRDALTFFWAGVVIAGLTLAAGGSSSLRSLSTRLPSPSPQPIPRFVTTPARGGLCLGGARRSWALSTPCGARSAFDDRACGRGRCEHLCRDLAGRDPGAADGTAHDLHSAGAFRARCPRAAFGIGALALWTRSRSLGYDHARRPPSGRPCAMGTLQRLAACDRRRLHLARAGDDAGDARAEATDGAGPYRVLTTAHAFTPDARSPPADPSETPPWPELLPNMYMMHGIETATGYDGFGLARYSRLADEMKLWGELPYPEQSLNGEGRAFDILNVRYLVARNASHEVAKDPRVPPIGRGARWRRVAALDEVSVYENADALPRAWVTPEAVVLGDEETLSVVRTGRLPDGRGWDPRQTALVNVPLGIGARPGSNTQSAQAPEARLLRYGPNRIDVQATTTAPVVLVLSENFYPGWRVTLNGRDAELLRINYNLRGVVLPGGRHDVRFIYRPRSVAWGMVVSLLTAFGLAAWCAAPHSLRLRRELLQ